MLRHALDAAKTAFDDAKGLFETDVGKIVDAAILATKNGVQTIIDDAKAGGAKLNQLRVDVDTELKAKFAAIEQDLIDMKKKFSAEMDDVVSFGRREVVKVEQKFGALATQAKSISTAVALAAIGFSIAAGIGIIYLKERNAGAEYEQWKKERAQGSNATSPTQKAIASSTTTNTSSKAKPWSNPPK